MEHLNLSLDLKSIDLKCFDLKFFYFEIFCLGFFKKIKDLKFII